MSGPLSACNLPSISLPNLPDIIAILLSLLPPLPTLPTIPVLPPVICPLDLLPLPPGMGV